MDFSILALIIIFGAPFWALLAIAIYIFFHDLPLYPIKCRGCGRKITKEEIEKRPCSGWRENTGRGRKGGGSGHATHLHTHFICPACATEVKL